MHVLLFLIPLFPLLAAVTTLPGLRRLPREKMHWPALLGCGLSLLCSLLLLGVVLLHSGSPGPPLVLYRWAGLSGRLPLDIDVTLQGDGLSALLLAMVAFVTTASVWYTARVAEFARIRGRSPRPNSCEFGYVEPLGLRFFIVTPFLLFAAAMFLLSPNFLQLYFFWQLLSVGAYLLIVEQASPPARPHDTAGHDRETQRGVKFQPAREQRRDLASNFGQAGSLPYDGADGTRSVPATLAGKLFLVHRLADVSVLVGIGFVWMNFGSLEFAAVLADAGRLEQVVDLNPAAAGLIALCFLAGVVARCAQFPLFGWLDEVGRGPAVINAVVQGAVVMPAGVYLVLRTLPFFEASPNARLLMASVGGFTALLAAIVTIRETDFKQVLSFSSVGHFGLVLLGLGSGLAAGVAAAVFHLIVHSLVKAYLFLAAGDVSRAVGGSSDFGELGGLRRVMPTSYAMVLSGSLILVSGLWGQNAIVASLWEAARPVSAPVLMPDDVEEVLSPFGAEPVQLYQTLMWLAMVSLLLMAFALFRAFFLTFHHGEPPMVSARGGAAEPSCKVGMLFLVAAVMMGFLVPGVAEVTNALQRIVERSVDSHRQAGSLPYGLFVAGPGSLLALLGLVSAWMLCAGPTTMPERLTMALGPVTRLGRHRFYLEEFYSLFVINPLRWLARLLRFFDTWMIDGLFVGLPERLLRLAELAAKPLRTGQVQFYALSLVLSAAALTAVVTWLQAK